MQNVGGTAGAFGGREPRAWAERESVRMANRDHLAVLADRALPTFRRMDVRPARFDAARRTVIRAISRNAVPSALYGLCARSGHQACRPPSAPRSTGGPIRPFQPKIQETLDE